MSLLRLKKPHKKHLVMLFSFSLTLYLNNVLKHQVMEYGIFILKNYSYKLSTFKPFPPNLVDFS